MEPDTEKIGLGLYVSRSIIHENQGELDFISSKNYGTTFIFTFKIQIVDAEGESIGSSN
mgnify:CR=1 FL=1